MAQTTVKRRRGENPIDFMERAATLARQQGGSVDTTQGAICPSCAPFTGCEDRTVAILTYQHCYNCTYGEDLEPKARN